MENMDEIRQIFFTESMELLADMEERLLNLEVGSQDKEQLNAIFRCAHSIKGGSGAFGLDYITHFTHTLEALLDLMREGKLLPTREAIDLLLKSGDIVKQMLEMAKNNTVPTPDFAVDIVQALKSLTQSSGGTVAKTAPVASPLQSVVQTTTKQRYDIEFIPNAEAFATGNEPLLIFRELSRLGIMEITPDDSRIESLDKFDPLTCVLGWKIAHETTATQQEIADVFEFVQGNSVICIKGQQMVEDPSKSQATQLPATKTPAEETAAAKSVIAATSSIRVDIEKVDRLVNMVGELVITEAMISAQVRNLPEEKFSVLLRGVEEFSQHMRELQEAVMSVRMQPVKSVFSRMPRIVRDTAAMLGKDIQITMSGENTEVDKTVIEQLSDPLTHMIRNSIDHGIETPDQRVWNDKPVQGNIYLSAGQKSGRIIIEVSDDGAGINREKVLSKAIEKGLVAADAKLSDSEIDHLIFLPGFSTAEKVTNVSGRGVGMDVVRRNIENLGGTVRITNNPGKGSIFTVSLPLTLAILDGMIVRVGEENYIVPITSIIETMRPNVGEVNKVQGHGDVINVRGEFIPLIYLYDIFAIKGAEKEPSKALVVLVESGSQKMGIVVDELIGQQQVVIKSLEANADPVKGISGATILGDGRVSLILEIGEMSEVCRSQAHQGLTKVA